MYSGILDDLKGFATGLIAGSPQVSGAVNQLKAKVGEFLGLPVRYDRALAIIDAQPPTSRWNALKSSVQMLRAKYPSLETRLTGILSKVDQGFSLTTLTSAVPIATEVAGQLAAMKKIESSLGGATVSQGVRAASGFMWTIGLSAAALALFLAFGGRKRT